jgi:hypothetical protein
LFSCLLVGGSSGIKYLCRTRRKDAVLFVSAARGLDKKKKKKEEEEEENK